MTDLYVRGSMVLVVASWISAVAALPLPARGIVIDSFLTAQQAGPTLTRVPAPEVLGGTRGMQAGGTAPVTVSVGAGTLVFSQTSTGQCFASTRYDNNGSGLGPIDLTYGERVDAFQVTATSSTLWGILVAHIASGRYGNYVSELIVPVAPSSSPVVYLFPFSDFTMKYQSSGPASFTSVESAGLRFQSAAPSPAGQITLSSILLIPEPGALCLLALGGLAVTRRHRLIR